MRIVLIEESKSLKGLEALIFKKNLRNILKSLAKQKKISSKSEVTFLFSNDAKITELNNQFRGKNKPTNVLSFPNNFTEETNDKIMNSFTNLGDVIISTETCFKEAREQGKKFEHHMLHMALHGFLHILGYDHETESQAIDMEKIEITTLASLGIPNPYEIKQVNNQ